MNHPKKTLSQRGHLFDQKTCREEKDHPEEIGTQESQGAIRHTDLASPHTQK